MKTLKAVLKAMLLMSQVLGITFLIVLGVFISPIITFVLVITILTIVTAIGFYNED
jgi:hypothetical protein